ncbi:MAG: hypothetical protein J6I85_07165 [Clostridia bacterium]|nr:hypothetical protein [Clostridia bacterium]
MKNKTKRKIEATFKDYIEQHNKTFKDYNYIYQKISMEFHLEEMEKERIHRNQKEKNIKIVDKLPRLSGIAYEKVEEIDEELKKVGLLTEKNIPYIRSAITDDIFENVNEGNRDLSLISGIIEGHKSPSSKYIDIKSPSIVDKIKSLFKPKPKNKLNKVDESLVLEEIDDYNVRCEKVLNYNLKSNIIDSLIKKLDKKVIEDEDIYVYIEGMGIRKELKKLGFEDLIPEFEEKINKKYGIIEKKKIGRWTISIGKQPDIYENQIIRNNRNKIVMNPAKKEDSKDDASKKDGFEIDD